MEGVLGVSYSRLKKQFLIGKLTEMLIFVAVDISILFHLHLSWAWTRTTWSEEAAAARHTTSCAEGAITWASRPAFSSCNSR